jgi:exodeoxyribonuclease VII large subunit
VEPVGAGALQRAFELTKAKLETEGLFDPAHKKPIPRFPRSIGLVTSPEAAAYTDFLRILQNRWCCVDVIVRPSLVQGNDAPGQLADALAWFNRYHPVDIIVLTRGGGSMEDLQAFNSETVCRAVYASRIPVICGVGHERDTTLAELVADVRASTPSNAAERCVPDKREITWQLNHHAKTMEQIISGRIQRLAWSLQEYLTRMEQQVRGSLLAFDQLQQRLTSSFYGYQARLAGYGQHIESLTRRLHVSASHKLQRQQDVFERLEQLLSSFNPKGVLQRGYSISRGGDGKVIRSLKQVKAGKMIQTEVADGNFTSQVAEKGKGIVENGRLF